MEGFGFGRFFMGMFFWGFWCIFIVILVLNGIGWVLFLIYLVRIGRILIVMFMLIFLERGFLRGLSLVEELGCWFLREYWCGVIFLIFDFFKWWKLLLVYLYKNLFIVYMNLDLVFICYII